MRTSFQILIFLVGLHFAPDILAQAGLTEALGFEPWQVPGGESMVNDLNASAEQQIGQAENPDQSLFGGGGLSTLFGLFVKGAELFLGFGTYVTQGPGMLINLGFPAWAMLPAWTIALLYVVIDLYYYAMGRE